MGRGSDFLAAGGFFGGCWEPFAVVLFSGWVEASVGSFQICGQGFDGVVVHGVLPGSRVSVAKPVDLAMGYLPIPPQPVTWQNLSSMWSRVFIKHPSNYTFFF